MFELDTAGAYSTLYSFTGLGDDGYNPLAGVALDPAGNLYGTTPYGGASNCTAGNHSSVGCGIVFKLSPSRVETVLNLNGGDHPVACGREDPVLVVGQPHGHRPHPLRCGINWG